MQDPAKTTSPYISYQLSNTLILLIITSTRCFIYSTLLCGESQCNHANILREKALHLREGSLQRSANSYHCIVQQYSSSPLALLEHIPKTPNFISARKIAISYLGCKRQLSMTLIMQQSAFQISPKAKKRVHTSLDLNPVKVMLGPRWHQVNIFAAGT